MKINVNEFYFAPTHIDPRFRICCFGEAKYEIAEWIQYWKLETRRAAQYTDIFITEDHPISEMFLDPHIYEYVDGFSPNLNKHLHVGHLSNLVYAKAFQGLGIGKNFIAIFGDTLSGEVKQEDALDSYEKYCKVFNYTVNKYFFASKMKLKDYSNLVGGEETYATTKVFKVGDEKIVGIKSDGSTTYFFQDVALAQELEASTLYLTGMEQDNHFNLLHKLYPQVSHLGLGLITMDGKKMSSSEGNVIFLKDAMNELLPKFNDDYNLVYNVLAGNIIKTEPKVVKKIDSNTLIDPTKSTGLYLSYTMARMHSAGIKLISTQDYKSVEMKIRSFKSKYNLKPHMLYIGVIEKCEEINALYRTHRIKDNKNNETMFQDLTYDLMLGVKELGLLPVEKV